MWMDVNFLVEDILSARESIGVLGVVSGAVDDKTSNAFVALARGGGYEPFVW